MPSQYPKITALIVLVALLLSACLGSARQATPISNEAAFTQAAQTIIAEMTTKAKTQAPGPSATSGVMALPASPTLESLPSTSTPLPSETPLPTDTPPPPPTPLPTNTPLPTPTLTATTPPEPVFQPVFSDDFQRGSTGWYDINTKTAKFNFTLGGYTLLDLSKRSYLYSARTNETMQFIDVRIEVTASRLDGPTDGLYGVICRFGNGSNYYFMAVGPDGWYGIGKMRSNVPSYLIEGRNTTNIYTGNSQNVIRADCIGDILTLSVNGVVIATAQDSDFSAGGVGLMIGTRALGGFKALFDDFKIFEPQ